MRKAALGRRGASDVRGFHLGDAYLERGPAHDMVELLYLSGELAEARPLAVRASGLQQRS
ncbi:hypothetical protein WME89_01025 [Sorangium sp. So ce321]|uniref:hypothetical protein n=1 Tax=Sorangium sp. So ce321 TaxID=3133300 RepID=UPI003F5DA5FC